MLTGIFPAYVGRFACDWHRLSTTDAEKPPFHYTVSAPGGVKKNAANFGIFSAPFKPKHQGSSRKRFCSALKRRST